VLDAAFSLTLFSCNVVKPENASMGSNLAFFYTHSLSFQGLETLLIQLYTEFCHPQLSMHCYPQEKLKDLKKTIEASKNLTVLPFPNL
jgi:hypothetical protein